MKNEKLNTIMIVLSIFSLFAVILDVVLCYKIFIAFYFRNKEIYSSLYFLF